MPLCTLSTGDLVYRYCKSIVISFCGPRKILSTSILNGGYQEQLSAVFNHDCNPGAGMACKLRAETYEAHMRLVAEELGLDPERSAGIGTAANMKNLAMYVKTYEDLTVTALVTGGVEVNGGRVGDPAAYYQPREKLAGHKPGTINIMLVIDADMPAGTLARALVTCTEAKTAVLQELMAGSNYSSGIATGSGTDSTIVIANPASPLYFESAGKHAKLGELIGLSVKEAVKEALKLQTGLSPASQHSVLARMKRFGITETGIWDAYKNNGGIKDKMAFLDRLHEFEADGALVTCVSLYAHLLDQQNWSLLSSEEVEAAAAEIRGRVAAHYHVAFPQGSGASVDGQVRLWTALMANIAAVCETVQAGEE